MYIRTLAIIGSDAALEMLEDYADDARSSVVDELLNVWGFFYRKTYAKHILSQTFQITSELRRNDLPSLDGMACQCEIDVISTLFLERSEST
jgi:hypothetical protein